MVNPANRHSLCGGELLKCRNLRFDQCTIHFPISISLRVAGAADLQGLQIISGSQQPLIFIMAPHQGEIRQMKDINQRSIWSSAVLLGVY